MVDESHQHEGHAGHRPGGQTHFRVHIVSEAFRGKSRIERHRMINQTLSGELAGGVHALAIHANAPGEGDVARHFNGTCTNFGDFLSVSGRGMHVRFTASVISPLMPFTVFAVERRLGKELVAQAAGVARRRLAEGDIGRQRLGIREYIQSIVSPNAFMKRTNTSRRAFRLLVLAMFHPDGLVL